MTASDHAQQRPQRFPLPERGRPQMARLSPINSSNLIIVGRCSPSLQPKRQATWWRLQRSQSLSVTRMKRIESGMWNLKASLDEPRCTDRSFWWHRPDCFCGPAALPFLQYNRRALVSRAAGQTLRVVRCLLWACFGVLFLHPMTTRKNMI
jgi:hypothetical protein